MAKYRKIKRDETPPTRKPLAGLDRYRCEHHGFIVDALQGSDVKVWCPCGRVGKKTASGPERKES